MRNNLFLATIFMMTGIYGYAQSAQMAIKLVDSSFKDPGEFLFKVSIKNPYINQYWVQDIVYLQQEVEYPSANLIYLYLWKKDNKGYRPYESFKHRPGILRAKCIDSCCNCISIKKGETLSFNVNMLKCCNLQPGSYKMFVALMPPTFSPNPRKYAGEIHSNYIYFYVKE